MTGARTYVLSPRDRTGVLLGLDGAQVAILGLAVVVFVFATTLAGLPVALIGASGLAVVAVRVDDRPILAVVPAQLRRVRDVLGNPPRWFAELPVTGSGAPLPPALDGQVILEVPADGIDVDGRSGPVAVVHDRVRRCVAVTLRARGRRFALLDRDEQDRLAQLWGDALAPFASAASPITAVRWAEWTGPAGLQEQRAWLAERGRREAPDYAALLETAAPAVAAHEVLVTLVASDRTVGLRRSSRRSVAAASESLLAEARLFGQRLDAAGIEVVGPLTAAELRGATRVRLDPGARCGLEGVRTLGERIGVVAEDGGPLAAQRHWRHWAVDGSVHRVFYVAEWPRLPVTADWLQGVLLHAGLVRTVAVTYEPVSPSSSRRKVERQATKLATDAEQRERSGFRVGGQHDRVARAVLEREQELVAGFAEFRYVGLVDVCAPDVSELDRACEELVQVAAAAGVELRPLHGRHDAAVAAVLPLARTAAGTGLRP